MSSTPEPRPSEAPLMTPAVKGVGGGRGWVGRGNPKMEQRGPSSRHTACVLAVRLPSSIVSSNSLNKIASSYIYVRQERSSSETNNRAPDTLKKKTRFHEKKKG